MTDALTNDPKVAPVIEGVIDEIERAADSQYIQVTVSKVTPRISAKVRNAIYNVGIVLGAIGTIAPTIAAFLTGDAQLATVSAGALALALTNLLAKLNLSKTAEDVVKEL